MYPGEESIPNTSGQPSIRSCLKPQAQQASRSSSGPALHCGRLGALLQVACKYTFWPENECRRVYNIYEPDCLKRSILFGKTHRVLNDDNREKDMLYALPAVILSTEYDLSHTGLVSLSGFATCSSRND